MPAVPHQAAFPNILPPADAFLGSHAGLWPYFWGLLKPRARGGTGSCPAWCRPAPSHGANFWRSLSPSLRTAAARPGTPQIAALTPHRAASASPWRQRRARGRRAVPGVRCRAAGTQRAALSCSRAPRLPAPLAQHAAGRSSFLLRKALLLPLGRKLLLARLASRLGNGWNRSQLW